jgi:uncharacterized membrane protein
MKYILRNLNFIDFMKKHADKIILAILISLYIGTLSTLSVLRHNAFASYFDLSNMDHTLWNTLYGRFFSLRFGEDYVSRLSVHADFILILLSPLYLIWDDVRALIISESVFLGLGAIPAYLLANKILKDRILALLIVVIYLLNPAMHWTDIYDFHGVALAIPLLLAAFYSMYIKNWKWFAIFAFLSILTKEQISLYIMMIGIFMIFVFKERKKGIMTSLIGLFWFVTMVFIVIPYFSPGGSHWGLDMYQSSVGIEKTSIKLNSDSLRTFNSPEALNYYNNLLKPFAYIPIMGLPWLLLSLPEIGINVLGMGSMKTIQFHYDSGITPSLVIASIFGFYYINFLLQKFKFSKKFSKKIMYVISVGVLLIVLRTIYYHSPLPITPSCWCFIYKVTDEDRDFEKVLQNIPKDASITASIEIRPHVNHRKDVYFIPIATESAQFIALITQNRLVGNYEPKEIENRLIPMLLSSKEHIVRYRSEHFYLFEKIK